MTDPIDYSRPVGWWCPVCGETVAVSVGPYGAPPQRFCANVLSGSVFCWRGVIPRYLPIPEGHRPPAASEVEEAEVVVNGGDGWVTVPGHNAGSAQQAGPLTVEANPVYWINYIVTGATE